MSRLPRADRTLVMGIINITTDSFSDGGEFASTERAIAHGHELLIQGADLIDIGGESTRPGAHRVSAADERTRVVPVIRELSRSGAMISVDTMRADVARAAVEGLLCLLAVGLEAQRAQGVAIERVALVGGGSRSAATRALAPGVLGVPVEVPEPAEYVALGAARQAAWVLGGGSEPPRWAASEPVRYEAPDQPWLRARYARAATQLEGFGLS